MCGEPISKSWKPCCSALLPVIPHQEQPALLGGIYTRLPLQRGYWYVSLAVLTGLSGSSVPPPGKQHCCPSSPSWHQIWRDAGSASLVSGCWLLITKQVRKLGFFLNITHRKVTFWNTLSTIWDHLKLSITSPALSILYSMLLTSPWNSFYQDFDWPIQHKTISNPCRMWCDYMKCWYEYFLQMHFWFWNH